MSTKKVKVRILRTKEDIEDLVELLKRVLKKRDYCESLRFYYNNRCDDFDCLGEESVLEDTSPFDYIPYPNPQHILSMSYEGSLCDYLEYHGCFPPEFQEILNKFGLYYERCTNWAMTICVEDPDKYSWEYTDYTKETKNN